MKKEEAAVKEVLEKDIKIINRVKEERARGNTED